MMLYDIVDALSFFDFFFATFFMKTLPIPTNGHVESLVFPNLQLITLGVLRLLKVAS
jgi:hypothetical protein